MTTLPLAVRNRPDHRFYLSRPALYVRIIEGGGQHMSVRFQVYLVIKLIVGYKCRR